MVNIHVLPVFTEVEVDAEAGDCDGHQETGHVQKDLSTQTVYQGRAHKHCSQVHHSDEDSTNVLVNGALTRLKSKRQ